MDGVQAEMALDRQNTVNNSVVTEVYVGPNPAPLSAISQDGQRE